MLRSYLRTALRNILRHKISSLINICGLALGLTCVFLIALYLQNELSFDKYHKNHERIYRLINYTENMPGTVQVYPLIGPKLVEDYPQVEKATRFFKHWYQPLISTEKKAFTEESFIFADRHVFEVFSFEFIEGDPLTALQNPFSLVLTESTAQKYFGGDPAVGKTLMYNSKHEFKITGIIKGPPSTSHFTFDFLGSLQSLPAIMWPSVISSWGMGAFPTYILVKPTFEPDIFERKLPRFVDTYMGADLKKRGQSTHLVLQKLSDIHLQGNIRGDFSSQSDLRYIQMLSLVALLILIIACINYVNLSTARSLKRAKEIGLRKVVGAQRRNLVFQILGESVLVSLVAGALGLLLTLAAMPFTEQLIGRELDMSFVDTRILALVFLFVLLTGLISGLYPALYLSGFEPVKSLKGIVAQNKASILLRKVLVVSQYGLSIALVLVTIVVIQQLNYFQHKKLGFNPNEILILPVRDKEVFANYNALKHRLLQDPGVLSVAQSGSMPGQKTANMTFDYDGNTTGKEVFMRMYWIGYDFLKTYGIEIMNGREFSRSFSTDKVESVMINQNGCG